MARVIIIVLLSVFSLHAFAYIYMGVAASPPPVYERPTYCESTGLDCHAKGRTPFYHTYWHPKSGYDRNSHKSSEIMHWKSDPYAHTK